MGRPRGSPNQPKRALLRLIQEKWPNYHPILAMADQANDPGLEEKLRFDAHKEVAKYVCPQLKAVEHVSEDGTTLVPAFVMIAPKAKK